MEIIEQQQEYNELEWRNDTIGNRYKEGLAYHNSMKYTTEWVENVNFYDGEQWNKAVTEATKSMPRPVFNIIKYIVNHKVSSVLNEAVKMVFTSQEIEDQEVDPALLNMNITAAMDGADKFTKYSGRVWENIQQERLNEEMMFDAALLGTGIIHYFWNNDLKGGVVNEWVGDIEGETLDPLNVFFGNPQRSQVQKQPYIVISSRELEETVREIAAKNGVPPELVKEIQGDDERAAEGYESAQQELQSTKKVTVLTQYTKKGGQVLFTKVCNNIVIQKETETGLKLYPLVVMQYEPRKKSIHGNSDVRGVITNQKGINFLLAMMLLSAQNTSFPKILSKPGAIKQEITNMPGEILTDHSGMPGMDGIKYMSTGGFNAITLTLVDKFIEITQKFAGAQDVSMGDSPGANMAASAIMMLQKSAGVSTDGIRKRFYRAMEDVGRVWEEFWKTKYNLPRSAKVTDELGQESMEEFIGTDYQDISFDLKIDIGAGGTYSESLAQSTLENLFNTKAIDLLTYLKYSPKSAMPYKDSLIKDIEEQQQQQQFLMQQQQQQILDSQMSPEVLGMAAETMQGQQTE